ncbi:RAB6-interacting golgin [Scaptodrosophila lebanonensis]|uniref:RAB6-interacting golgin n=1 Tax=Drosophila lebanonensis TaxID=7225 RepID=A0A6J2U9V7_DROLE|nr:RAB6-interacting golgin [Scaptodrosophila lebanonensis]
MADKFNGFSQDEIIKITGVKQNGRPSAEAMKQALKLPGIRRMPDKISGKAEQLKRQQSQHSQQHQQVAATTAKAKPLAASAPAPAPVEAIVADDVRKEDSLNLERDLSDSLVQALYCGSVQPTARQQNGKNAATSAEGTDGEVTDDSSILKMSKNTTATDDDASILPSSKDSNGDRLNTDSPFKGISLKDFEQHRKMIQEQNKQKKQMLYEAIEQHTQKTAAESRKIEEIRHELSKLESDLAVDVALLRKQIDNASLHFATVEKQYIKIEAQFLKAKMDLHSASEKKELLTEHLCTVIAHNEDRKAQKLTELMQKVGLAPTDEPIEMPEH